MSSSSHKNFDTHLEARLFVAFMQIADSLGAQAEQVIKAAGLTAAQYNVLRILRGAGRTGLACREIGERMISRDPDITRLLDRMEKRGLISRSRESRDRRLVLARITPEGLKLLARLDEPVQEAHRKQLRHLGRERLGALTDLLQAARASVS